MFKKALLVGGPLILLGAVWLFWNPLETPFGKTGWVGAPVVLTGVIILLAPVLRGESPRMWVPWYEFLIMDFMVLPLVAIGLLTFVCGGLLALVYKELGLVLWPLATLIAAMICVVAVQGAGVIGSD